MNRRTLLKSAVGIAGIAAPSLLLAQSKTTRIYTPFSRNNFLWNDIMSKAADIVKDVSSGDIDMESVFLMEVPEDFSIFAVKEGSVDFGIAASETDLLGQDRLSHLFFNMGFSTPEKADQWALSTEAETITADLASTGGLNVRPLASCCTMGLGWFNNLSQAAAVAKLGGTPKIMTNYGWARLWNASGFEAINFPSSYYYQAAEDKVGAQYENIRMAEALGSYELWKQVYLPSAMSVSPIQHLISQNDTSSELTILVQSSLQMAITSVRDAQESEGEAILERNDGRQVTIHPEVLEGNVIVKSLEDGWAKMIDEAGNLSSYRALLDSQASFF